MHLSKSYSSILANFTERQQYVKYGRPGEGVMAGKRGEESAIGPNARDIELELGNQLMC